MNLDAYKSYAQDLSSVLMETTRSRSKTGHPFLAGTSSHLLPLSESMSDEGLTDDGEPVDYSLRRLGSQGSGSDARSACSDTSSTQNVVYIGPNSPNSRLAQAEMADSLSYALVAANFQKREYYPSITCKPFYDEKFFWSHIQGKELDLVSQVVLAAFQARGSRITLHSGILQRDLPTSGMITYPTPEYATTLATVGEQRENACLALTQRMINIAEDTTIFRTPSVEGCILLIFIARTLRIVTPESYWTILRFISRRTVRFWSELVNDPTLPLEKLERLKTYADACLITDAECASRLDLPCYITEEQLVPEYGFTPIKQDKAIRHLRHQVSDPTFGTIEELENSTTRVYQSALRGIANPSLEVSSADKLDGVLSLYQSILDMLDTIKWALESKQSLLNLYPEWRNSLHALEASAFSLECQVALKATRIHERFHFIEPTLALEFQTQAWIRLVNATARLVVVLQQTRIATELERNFIARVFLPLVTVPDWADVLASAADQNSSGKGVLAGTEFSWATLFELRRFFQLGSFTFNITAQQLEELEQMAMQCQSYPFSAAGSTSTTTTTTREEMIYTEVPGVYGFEQDKKLMTALVNDF